MSTTVYISGPMTGYVDHNREAFFRAEEYLREDLGFEVVNPARLDDLDGRTDLPHHVYLRRDIRAMTDCDAIYLLPGWKHSKGARLEQTVAEGIGLVEIKDIDKTLWRTFEGSPVEESAPECGDTLGPVPSHDDHLYVRTKAEGHDLPHSDGEHTTWTKDSPAEEPVSEGCSEVEDEDLSDHPQWRRLDDSPEGRTLLGDIDYAVDPSLPRDTVRIETPAGALDFDVSWRDGQMLLNKREQNYHLAEVTKPREDDLFPDVGYVRRFKALFGVDDAHNVGERKSA